MNVISTLQSNSPTTEQHRNTCALETVSNEGTNGKRVEPELIDNHGGRAVMHSVKCQRTREIEVREICSTIAKDAAGTKSCKGQIVNEEALIGLRAVAKNVASDSDLPRLKQLEEEAKSACNTAMLTGQVPHAQGYVDSKSGLNPIPGKDFLSSTKGAWTVTLEIDYTWAAISAKNGDSWAQQYAQSRHTTSLPSLLNGKEVSQKILEMTDDLMPTRANVWHGGFVLDIGQQGDTKRLTLIAHDFGFSGYEPLLTKIRRFRFLAAQSGQQQVPFICWLGVSIRKD
jgi:hypothetical protein